MVDHFKKHPVAPPPLPFKNFKIAWKLRTDSEAAGFRYFLTQTANADSAREVFFIETDAIGITQGEIRIIYVSLA